MFESIVITGASGSIGRALIQQLAINYPTAEIHAISRSPNTGYPPNVKSVELNYNDETSIKQVATTISKLKPIDLVIVANGILHTNEVKPEKSLKDLSANNFETLFKTNTIVPALFAKYFLPHLNKKDKSVFAALSARVGSISDNRLGGWYAYRASKAALNMILKNAAIETKRTNKNAIIVGLHPGTVDSALSKPFQANVPAGKLFTPEFSASQLIEVINNLKPEQSGKCFAWDGKEIAP